MTRKPKIFCFPVTLKSANQYLPNLVRNLSGKYNFMSWEQEAWKKFGFGIPECDIIFLNWIEAIKGNHSAVLRVLSYVGRSLLLRYFSWSGKPIVWTCHDKLSHETSKDRYVSRLMIQAARAASRIHCLCRATMELPEIEPYRDKCVIVPHGDYFGNYGSTGQDLRAKYDIAQDQHVLLFLGLVKRYKNIEILLDSFNEAVKTSGRKDITLLIVGKCEDSGYKKELLDRLTDAGDQVRFDFSYVANEEIGDYLALADASVAPYPLRSMLNSGTFWMMCSYGIPMIVPEIGGVCDNPDRQSAGWFYSYDSEEAHRAALTESMLAFFEDTKNGDILKRKSDEARAWMERNSWKNNLDKWIALFDFSSKNSEDE